jgi:hypothetical protein
MPTRYEINFTDYSQKYSYNLLDDDMAIIYICPKYYKSYIAAIGAATSKLRAWR